MTRSLGKRVVSGGYAAAHNHSITQGNSHSERSEAERGISLNLEPKKTVSSCLCERKTPKAKQQGTRNKKQQAEGEASEGEAH